MVQDRLVEYISSQLKLGVSRDAIKTALTGVGWAAPDVEDTLKKVGAVSSASVTSAAPSAAPTIAAPATAVTTVKSSGPQVIKVSDLVSSVTPSSGASSSSSGNQSFTATKDATPVTTSKTFPSKGSSASSFSIGTTTEKVSLGKKSFEWTAIIAIILAIVFAGAVVYLFVQNGALNSKIQALNNENQGASQSVATQVQALNASNTALSDEVASMTAENQDLLTNLSFLVAPTASSTPATSTSVSVSGMLAAGLGKNTYFITTPYGVKVSVKNSSDKNVAAALEPLLGTSVQLAGTYIPGTQNIVVATVNGNSVTPPPATVATSTASSTISGASMTTPTSSATTTNP
jgi:hypothetical protein